MPQPPKADPQLTARLAQASKDLKSLEQDIKTGMVDMRVLSDFRDAVNHARTTAWAVQRWVEEEQKAGGDPFEVVNMVVTERIRLVTEISQDIVRDIDGGGVDFHTEGIAGLHKVTKDLLDRLARFIRE